MKSILKWLALTIAISYTMVVRAQEIQPMLGEVAPSFTLKDINSKTYSLEQLRGRYTVIHFATTWCPFCNAEAPNLEQLYKDYSDHGVSVFIIDVKEDKELVEKSFSRLIFLFPCCWMRTVRFLQATHQQECNRPCKDTKCPLHRT